MKQTLGQAITIPAGLSVKLTGEQAKVRSHLLGSSKAGTYKLKEELQFKAGEEIEIVGKIPKGILPAFLLDKSEDGEVTVQQVANAITALNGETKVADLSRHLNAKVTAALRDEAVELLKQQPSNDSENATLEEVVQAMQDLDEEDETLWVEDKPNRDIITENIGKPITDEIYDEAYSVVFESEVE